MKGLVPFLSHQEIGRIVKRLAGEITRDFLHKEVVILCPLRGSVFFLSDLIRHLNLCVLVDFVLIETDGEHFTIKKDISLKLKDRHILIVDSIIDSGLTISFLTERVRQARPASLKTAVLLDKTSHRRVFVQVDYVGQVIEDRFIVGYGMHIEGEGRHYPDIYQLGQ